CRGPERALGTPAGRAAGRSCGGFESLLQVLHVPRHFLLHLPSGYERNDELADPVAVKVELDRDTRPPAIVERLDHAFAISSDGAVEPTDGPAPRRIEIADLDRHCHVARTDVARDGQGLRAGDR